MRKKARNMKVQQFSLFLIPLFYFLFPNTILISLDEFLHPNDLLF